MAASKKNKKPCRAENPSGKMAKSREDPTPFYSQHPSWNFSNLDDEKWAFNKERLADRYWDEILPFMQSLERMTWNEILLKAKTQNHSLKPFDLNKDAQKRLVERTIEEEAIISLRISAKHRMYGFMDGAVFNILWYDDDHGDNETCVCRSRKKHT